MSNRFIDKQIVKEIERKMRDLSSGIYFHPISLIAGKHQEYILQNDAMIHSYKMENQGLGEITNFTLHPTNKKSVRDGIKRNRDAFNWAFKRFNPNKFDEEFVKSIAKAVEPEVFARNLSGYREMGVRPAGATWTPPYPAKISSEMEKYLAELKQMLEDDSTAGVLESAAYAHLHLDRIHPFEDGNGRTARIIQNVILKKMRGLPPPLIYPGERFDYNSHLDRAINDWRDRTGDSTKKVSDSVGEKAFYNYIAGKVSASLDRILEKTGR